MFKLPKYFFRFSEYFCVFSSNRGPGKEPEVTEKEWADENKDIEFLTDETFESFVQKETCVLVMFYTGCE